MPRIIAPRPGPDQRFFWEGIAGERLLVRACANCGRRQHPPSPMCPDCRGVDWVDEELSGRGTVLSWIISRHPSRTEEAPRVVALVETDEGPRLVSNICDVDVSALGQSGDSLNGATVEVCFVAVTDDVVLPQFRLADEVVEGGGR